MVGKYSVINYKSEGPNASVPMWMKQFKAQGECREGKECSQTYIAHS